MTSAKFSDFLTPYPLVSYRIHATSFLLSDFWGSPLRTSYKYGPSSRRVEWWSLTARKLQIKLPSVVDFTTGVINGLRTLSTCAAQMGIHAASRISVKLITRSECPSHNCMTLSPSHFGVFLWRCHCDSTPVGRVIHR